MTLFRERSNDRCPFAIIVTAEEQGFILSAATTDPDESYTENHDKQDYAA